MDSLVYEGNTHSFRAVSRQAADAISGFTDEEWLAFLVGAAVCEGSIVGGRPRGTIVRAVEGSHGLFVVDLSVVGGPAKLLCARRGPKVLIARVVARGRRVGKKEIQLAADALGQWRREQRRQRPDARQRE